MTNKNPYRENTYFGVLKTKKIIRYFAEDLTATTTSNLLGIERKTINKWYNYIRSVITYYALEEDKEVWKGIIEVDESYFGPTRVRGKRGRWAGDKIKVLGLLKRKGKVYVQIVPNCSSSELMPIIRQKVSIESLVNTDG